MDHFDFTPSREYQVKGRCRRPTAARILARWKLHGFPTAFSVAYGETYAEFRKVPGYPTGRWIDAGNGCRGVDRTAVVRALNAASFGTGVKPGTEVVLA